MFFLFCHGLWAKALSLLIFPQNLAERETLVVRFLRRLYTPCLEFVLANRIVTFTTVALIAVLAACATRSLGLEFLPKLGKSSFLRKQESSRLSGFIDSRFRGNDKKKRE